MIETFLASVYFCGVGDIGPLSLRYNFCFFCREQEPLKSKKHNNITETWHLRAVCANKSTPMVPSVCMFKSSIMSFCFLKVGPVNS